MRKEFNTTGSCNPQYHYMVDTDQRFQIVESLIDKGKYFTINRARQYGKTTMLNMIWRKLSDRYLVISLSFEGLGDESFAGPSAFVATFKRQMLRHLTSLCQNDDIIDIWRDSVPTTIEDLSLVISDFCRAIQRKVVVTIDEVDKSSDNQLFLSFLGMLRNKYLERNEGLGCSFHSVILAGVYDIKNLSPWNIAADFNVDMTFHPEEIAQMLTDYENDVHTGMDVNLMGEIIYKYTNGYPFLVSYVCKMIDERFDREWNEEGVVKAVKLLVQGESTLMDDLSKNLENNPEFREFMYSVSVNSISYPFSLLNPMVAMGNMFSYICKKNGRVAIHNLIFEEALFMYFTLDYAIKNNQKLSPFQMNYVYNGRLNMEHVVDRFRDLMREEYSDSTVPFFEREGRLLFLTFLKPIINGVGFYYVEPQTRDNRRMDLVVTYERQEFVVELKIWRGEKYEERGLDQLADYLNIRGLDEGYLITFDFSKNKSQAEPQWLEVDGKKIFEVVI